jgi:hypothetical protein
MLGNDVLLMHEGAVAYRQTLQDVKVQDSRRSPGWRYSPGFGAQASALRAAMDQLVKPVEAVLAHHQRPDGERIV